MYLVVTAATIDPRMGYEVPSERIIPLVIVVIPYRRIPYELRETV
jgi:hypothetical protein